MIRRIREWLTRRAVVGVTVEPVEQRPGFWPEWGVMTDEGFQPVQDADGQMQRLYAWNALGNLDETDVTAILDQLDVLVMEGNDLAILIAERIRREKAAAWDEVIGAAYEQGTIQVPNPYEADQ